MGFIGKKENLRLMDIKIYIKWDDLCKD
jgi:hypothetical protein